MVESGISDTSKNMLAAGLCRVLAAKAINVAQVKAKNMVFNSVVTPESHEIGQENLA